MLLYNVLQLLFVAIAAYGQWQHSLKKYIDVNGRRLLYGFLAINLFIPAVFVTDRWFLLDRFVTPAALVILLWVPFTLPDLYHRWQSSQYAKRFPWFCAHF